MRIFPLPRRVPRGDRPSIPPRSRASALPAEGIPRGIRIVLERNPYYWKKDRAGQSLPYLDTMTFLVIPDLNSEALRFQQGDWIW